MTEALPDGDGIVGFMIDTKQRATTPVLTLRTSLLFAAAALALGCGGGGETCKTANCSIGTRTLQICSTNGSTVITETYGGQSCQFDTANQSSSSSAACEGAIANYCATGSSGGGSGGANGGGSGGSSGGGSGGSSGGSGGGGATCVNQGAACTPSNICDNGEIECNSSGSPGCTDQHTADSARNGVTCDNGSVCFNGSCNACAQGSSCTPSGNVCDQGTIDCTTGAAICHDTGNGNTSADGNSCGSGGTCANGVCGTCSAGASCTPTNICDLGSLTCSAGGNSCTDTGSPNNAQNGVTCGSGMTCNNGICGTISSSTTWPIVPDDGGDPVASPNLVFITYTNDSNESLMDGFAQWIATQGYIATVAGEYGVGNGTYQNIHLSATTYPTPTNTTNNDNAFPDYFNTLFAAHAIPAYAANNIYILIIPSSWSDTDTFCTTAGGYHTYYNDNSFNSVLYAIIPNCLGTSSLTDQTNEIEVAISHEVIEASTDPLIGTYQIQDMTNPWFYLGGEVGDLCSSNYSYYTSGQYVAQLIWSNNAVTAGKVPCQPWNDSNTYYSLVGPATMATGRAGTKVKITLTGWSSLPSTLPMGLGKTDGDYYVDFATQPTLSADTVVPGDTVTVTLTIPANAQSGQHGAAWILAADPISDTYEGSTMVGVTVE